MRARFAMMLMLLGLAVATLPVGGCGDNDNSVGVPCCPVCGDGVCSGDETGCNCGQDCDDGLVCRQIESVCGDGVCDRGSSPSESHERCPEDCPLDCGICEENQLRLAGDGLSGRGSSCPAGYTEAYRDSGYLVCDVCKDGERCRTGAACTIVCGPGCEDDTGGCCPMRVCAR